MGQPTAVSLPGESPWTEEPGWYSPWGRKELDMTERLSTAHKNEYSLLRIGLFKGYLVVIKNTTSE